MSKKSTEQKPEVATVALVQSAQEEEDTITIPVMQSARLKSTEYCMSSVLFPA